MAKQHSRFVCQSCGSEHPRWTGRCESCGAWNAIVEEAVEASPHSARKPVGGRALAFEPLTGDSPQPPRAYTGIGEFDRVLGGGLVAGSAVLIGGDPGIGKSTLLLQAAAAYAAHHRVAYVSGEESLDQVRLRAARLGLAKASLGLAATTNLRELLAALDRRDGPRIVIVDSIQTMFLDTLESAPGTVAQVRACAGELIRVGKKHGIAILLVGHVTKDGAIAGPRVLEHMVDAVLYFEGDRGHQFRILRGVKNRFGPTDEIGVFEMTDRGLAEVANPSQLFLSDRRADVAGTAVFAGIEGTRPLLVEIQALVGPPVQGTPRRAVVGWDSARLAMVLAVLEARCGLIFAGHDVYLNVAGGLRIAEPAADLAVAAALLSALSERAMPPDCVVFGEIGLAGEVRPVGQPELRLKEAQKLGFARAVVPAGHRRGRPDAGIATAMTIAEIGDVGALARRFADPSPRRDSKQRSMETSA
jgi:DNA repair protein RadA/Sms